MLLVLKSKHRLVRLCPPRHLAVAQPKHVRVSNILVHVVITAWIRGTCFLKASLSAPLSSTCTRRERIPWRFLNRAIQPFQNLTYILKSPGSCTFASARRFSACMISSSPFTTTPSLLCAHIHSNIAFLSQEAAAVQLLLALNAIGPSLRRSCEPLRTMRLMDNWFRTRSRWKVSFAHPPSSSCNSFSPGALQRLNSPRTPAASNAA